MIRTGTGGVIAENQTQVNAYEMELKLRRKVSMDLFRYGYILPGTIQKGYEICKYVEENSREIGDNKEDIICLVEITLATKNDMDSRRDELEGVRKVLRLYPGDNDKPEYNKWVEDTKENLLKKGLDVESGNDLWSPKLYPFTKKAILKDIPDWLVEDKGIAKGTPLDVLGESDKAYFVFPVRSWRAIKPREDGRYDRYAVWLPKSQVEVDFIV